MLKFFIAVFIFVLVVFVSYVPNSTAGANMFACLNPTTNQIRIIGTDCTSPTVPKAGPRSGQGPQGNQDQCTSSEIEIEWAIECTNCPS